jgi:DNA polymerase
MAQKGDQNTIGSLARDLQHRIVWESELGAEGYTLFKGTVDPLPLAREEVSAPDDPAQALSVLRSEMGDCRRCALSERRSNLVFGEGNPNARLVFVGEGPGRDEDLAGRPFVGAAGQLLDRIIGAMGLKREEVYICNVVKCRPPENRTPDEAEQRVCGVFVRRQLEIINPAAVVALGATAARYLLETDVPVSRLRGHFHKMGSIAVMPTYHPAYLLRNPSAKRAVWQDIQAVMAFLGLPGEDGR